MFEPSVVDTVVVTAQTFAAGPVQAGIFDTVNNLSTSAMTALKAVATLLVAVFVLWQAVKARFAIGAIVMYAIAGGAVLWLIWGGTNFFKDEVGNELENANAPLTTVTQLHRV